MPDRSLNRPSLDLPGRQVGSYFGKILAKKKMLEHKNEPKPSLQTAYLFQMEEPASLWPPFSFFNSLWGFLKSLYDILAKMCFQFSKLLMLWLLWFSRGYLLSASQWHGTYASKLFVVAEWALTSFAVVLTLGGPEGFWQRSLTNGETLPVAKRAATAQQLSAFHCL